MTTAAERDKRGFRLRRVLFGSRDSIAGTVYGTVVVMGAIAAGSSTGHADPWRLAAVVSVTVVVLWLAHVYAHSLGESIHVGRHLDRAEFTGVARRELAIPLAAVGPVAALLLGASDVMRESSAIWLALVIGVATLGVQGVRYSRAERLTRRGTIVAVAVNLLLGLAIVALEAAVAH